MNGVNRNGVNPELIRHLYGYESPYTNPYQDDSARAWIHVGWTTLEWRDMLCLINFVQEFISSDPRKLELYLCDDLRFSNAALNLFCGFLEDTTCQLRALVLGPSPRHTMLRLLSALRRNTSIDELDFWELQEEDDAIVANAIVDFLNTPRAALLRSIVFTNRPIPIPQLMQTLLGLVMPHLQKLSLRHYLLGDAAIGSVVQALGGSFPAMETLDFDGNGMSNLLLPDGGETNGSVINLSLSDNIFQGAVGGNNIGNVLRFFTNVQELSLSRNQLGPAGFHRLVIALRCRHFQRLDLSGCDLGNPNAWNRLSPLEDASISVTDLILSWNDFRGANVVGGEDILTEFVLPCFTDVYKLDLTGNDFDDVFLQTLSESVYVHDNVRCLNLSCPVRTDISYRGLESIKNMLQRCTMEKLEIGFYRDYSPQRVQALVDCLFCYSHLREVIVDLNVDANGRYPQRIGRGYGPYEADWMQNIFLSGMEKNPNLHWFEGKELYLSNANQRRFDSFLRRNRMIAQAKSFLDNNAALAASHPALLDALLQVSREEEDTNASWMILVSHANTLFPSEDTIAVNEDPERQQQQRLTHALPQMEQPDAVPDTRSAEDEGNNQDNDEDVVDEMGALPQMEQPAAVPDARLAEDEGNNQDNDEDVVDETGADVHV